MDCQQSFYSNRDNNNVRGFGGFNLEELKPCLVEVHMGKAQIIVGRVFVESACRISNICELHESNDTVTLQPPVSSDSMTCV
jgi:hypothetical protein